MTYTFTLKTAFLLAIKSAWRVRELCMFCANQPYPWFPSDVVLLPDVSFLPKVISTFHLGLDIILPVFFPSSQDDKESTCHALVVKRALSLILKHTFLKKDKAVFICYGVPQKVKKS